MCFWRDLTDKVYADGHRSVSMSPHTTWLVGWNPNALDPLAVLDTRENNSSYDIQWPSSDLHDLSISSSPSCPELRSFSQGQSWGQPCSATGESMAGSVHTWPPAVQCDGAVQNLMPRRGVAEYDILYYPDDRLSPRRALHQSTSSLLLSENLGTAIMLDAPQTIYGSSSLSARARTNSLPCVRCPPGDLWQATIAEDSLVGEVGSSPPSTAHGLVDDGRVCSSSSPASPPGLYPPRPKLTRRGSEFDLNASSSVSLSLAPGSQPLHASEHSKSALPIGAERSRVMRIISSRSPSEKSRLSSSRDTLTDDPSFHLWYPPSQSPKLQSKPKTASEGEKPFHPPYPGPISREDFRRLLRQATNNRFASKIFSPLNPLRASTPPSDLAADPTYISHIPSPTNIPSPRYEQSPAVRVRTYVLFLHSAPTCIISHPSPRPSVPATFTNPRVLRRCACTAASAKGIRSQSVSWRLNIAKCPVKSIAHTTSVFLFLGVFRWTCLVGSIVTSEACGTRWQLSPLWSHSRVMAPLPSSVALQDVVLIMTFLQARASRTSTHSNTTSRKFWMKICSRACLFVRCLFAKHRSIIISDPINPFSVLQSA
ncbi:hypothetical protein PISMIDRAFT_422207 [Pisolithus microcarpus 441]|uniref:Uncharacterized protein n=1 Tax=Pisolithus microcarpus 441 TaxID=765257 RepID=A0A0C9ZP27_9AGAM|nr:hypothetical protein PISMIDRAFT_422207 [Pisolithus microcarpus 441]